MTLLTCTQVPDALDAGSKKLKRLGKELGIVGPPEPTLAVIAQVRSCCSAMRALLGVERPALVARYAVSFLTNTGRPAGPGQRPKDDINNRYWTYKLGAYAALLFEMLVAASVAAQIFSLETMAAATLGVVITLVAAAILKATIGLAVARFEHHPQKALAQLHVWLKIAAPIWLISLFGTLLAVQTVSEPGPAIELLLVVSRTILSLASPLIAAILLTCAELIGWSRSYAASDTRFERLEFEINELESFCDEVENCLIGTTGKEESIVAQTLEKKEKTVGRAAVAVMAFFVTLAPLRLAAAGPCGQVWIDYSGSPDTRQMASAQRGVLDLAAKAEQTGIGCWDLFGFYSDPYSARRFHTIRVPAAPVHRECRPPERSEAGVFRKIYEAQKAKAQQFCDRQRRQAEEGYQSKTEEQTQQALQALKEPPVEFAEKKCTALRDLVDRLATQPQPPAVALILTDGEETCDPRNEALPPPTSDVRVVMVILSNGAKKQTAGQHFREIEHVWSQRAPWLTTIPPYALGPGVLRNSSIGPDGLVLNATPTQPALD